MRVRQDIVSAVTLADNKKIWVGVRFTKLILFVKKI